MRGVRQMDKNSLSHTRWNCKYHIVFAPKYRRQIIYGKIKVEIGKILRVLCERKGIEIIEAEACPDHIHMFANMKYRYWNRQFWCRGYYVDTVGRNKKAIEEYIRNQLQEDKEYEQVSMKEVFDPFTGEPVTKDKK